MDDESDEESDDEIESAVADVGRSVPDPEPEGVELLLAEPQAATVAVRVSSTVIAITVSLDMTLIRDVTELVVTDLVVTELVVTDLVDTEPMETSCSLEQWSRERGRTVIVVRL